MQQKILFISRNYPPKTGGLENYSYSLIKEFEKSHDVYKLVLSHSNLHLIWFLPFCLLRAIYLILHHSIDYVHLCDGVLAPIGWMVKMLTGAKVSISIHGLDITFSNRLYQAVVPPCAGRLENIICVSRSTRAECLARGISEGRCRVIPNGVTPEEFDTPCDDGSLNEMLSQRLGISLEDQKILVTVGRLIPRKGVEWFVGDVMPRLKQNFIYLIVGEGPQKAAIEQTIRKHSLEQRVFLVGSVPNDLRNMILKAADIFVMPNIRIPGDMEGFGIVALEAGSTGLPVVASAIQGIRDAVIDGITGYLVPERDAGVFIEKIMAMDLNRESIRSVVTTRFNWQRISLRYADALFHGGEAPKACAEAKCKSGTKNRHVL